MNTNSPGSGFPFGGNMLENLEMMSKAWGAGLAQMPGFAAPASMAQSIPSMMLPTLDINELDKRITDLRAVEQWLALNANMLRATIQTLEVQRNTIATIQTLGTTMMRAPAMAQEAQAAAAAAMAPRSASGSARETSSSAASEAAQAASAGTSASRRSKRAAASAEATPPNVAEMPLNPAAWWANLQDQFTRIAAAAAGDSGAKAGTAPSKDAAARSGAAQSDTTRERVKEDTRPAARKPPTRRAS